MKKLFTFDTAGQVGNNPRTVRLLTDATLAEVTAPGFVSQAELAPNALYSTDAILAIIGYNFDTQSGGALALLNPTISGDIITITEANTGSEVQLPVVVGRLAVFTNLSGQIGDPFVTASHVGALFLGQSGTAGYLRSYDTAPATGAFVFQGMANSGNFFVTLRNASFGQTSNVTIPDPGVSNSNVAILPAAVTANNLAVYNSTTGLLGLNAGTATTLGNLFLGKSGTPGALRSYDTAPTSGAFVFQGRANSGDFFIALRNNAMGQSTTINFPDPAAASCDVLLTAGSIAAGNLVVATGGDNGAMADIGAGPIAGSTPVYAGGGTSNAFSVSNMTSACRVGAVILTSTNDVSIVKCVPGAATLTVTFSADPGANTVVMYAGYTNSI